MFNVCIAIINHQFLMVYTTYLWQLGGWFIIAIPTLCGEYKRKRKREGEDNKRQF